MSISDAPDRAKGRRARRVWRDVTMTADEFFGTAAPEVVRVPLRNRGGDVVAYATVDAADADKVTPYRWHRHDGGYAATSVRTLRGPRGFLMHHLVVGCELAPGTMVDHANGDRLDNRRENLRVVTNKRNQENRRGAQRNSGTGVRGVCHCPGRAAMNGGKSYQAQVEHNGRKASRWFHTLPEAQAWVRAKREELGFLTGAEEVSR